MRGRLKIFLGYGSGVGKSYRMLDEGRRRRERGEDVVVGAVQPQTQGAALDALSHLEVIPMLRQGDVTRMDVDAIVSRNPGFCLVDGMAYDNPPGSRWAHRWEEIEYLLERGIAVIASVNLQFIEERQDEVERITGRRSAQTIPARLLLEADEIEVVDAPPTPGATNPAQRERLSALREVALLLAADVVDRQLETYLRVHGIEARWGTQERILVCVTPYTDTEAMIQSGRRNADRFRGELIVAHVYQRPLPADSQAQFEAILRRASEAGAEVARLQADDFVDAILPFAHSRGVTQIFVGHSIHLRWWQRARRSSLERLINGASDMDVRVFPH